METQVKSDYLFEFINYLIIKKRDQIDNNLKYKNNVIFYLGIAHARLGSKLDYNELKELIEQISDVLYYAPQYVKNNLEAGLNAEYLNISYDKLKKVFNLSDKFILAFKNRNKKRVRITKKRANQIRNKIKDKKLFNVKNSILAKIFKVSKSFIKKVKFEQKVQCGTGSNQKNEAVKVENLKKTCNKKNNCFLNIFESKLKEQIHSRTGSNQKNEAARNKKSTKLYNFQNF